MIASTSGSTASISTLIYVLVAVFTTLVVPTIGYLIRSTAKQLNDTAEQTNKLATQVVALEERAYSLQAAVDRHERLLERL